MSEEEVLTKSERVQLLQKAITQPLEGDLNNRSFRFDLRSAKYLLEDARPEEIAEVNKITENSYTQSDIDEQLTNVNKKLEIASAFASGRIAPPKFFPDESLSELDLLGDGDGVDGGKKLRKKRPKRSRSKRAKYGTKRKRTGRKRKGTGHKRKRSSTRRR